MTTREIPKYKCHKEVRALKIKDIHLYRGSGAQIIPEDEGYAPFDVINEYMKKHKPSPGGYYVVYEDGYESFSPAEAFENGYSKI